LRVPFGSDGKPGNRERILTDLMVRFRDVRLGPDGTIYLLTDETTDAVLRIDPAEKEGSGKNSMDRPHKL